MLAKDVHYLALEGGGGKGFAFIGAVQALEIRRLLPIDISQPGKNKIRGISGASAGAITALFLALGMRSDEVQDFLQSTNFNQLFDEPLCGSWRKVDENGQMGTGKGAVFLPQHPTESGIVSSTRLLKLLKGKPTVKNDAMLSRLVAEPDLYMQNLLFDRGLFPGFAARVLFRDILRERLGRVRKNQLLSGADGKPLPPQFDLGDVDLATFKRITGVDLVVTGSNLTTTSPGVFSSLSIDTETFPVADAVGLSMSLPFLFKPVEIAWKQPVRGDKGYSGFWVDGGLVNNFPLHAFDGVQAADDGLIATRLGGQLKRGQSAQAGEITPLNPNVLGLRLTEGPRPKFAKNPEPGLPTLADFVTRLIETAMYGSELGQIRSPSEAEQTIEILTYDLGLTNFTPDSATTEEPLDAARAKVLKELP